MHLRVQTTGRPARDVLREGLQELAEGCDYIRETFKHAVPLPEEGEER